MNAIRMLVCSLVLSACAAPLPIYAPEAVDGELPEEIVDACAILEIECEAVDDPYGAVTIDLRDEDECDPEDKHVAGWTDDAICEPLVCSERDPMYIAHELGHVLELDHVESESNLMDVGARGDELSDDQLDTVWRRAGYLISC